MALSREIGTNGSQQARMGEVAPNQLGGFVIWRTVHGVQGIKKRSEEIHKTHEHFPEKKPDYAWSGGVRKIGKAHKCRRKGRARGRRYG